MCFEWGRKNVETYLYELFFTFFVLFFFADSIDSVALLRVNFCFYFKLTLYVHRIIKVLIQTNNRNWIKKLQLYCMCIGTASYTYYNRNSGTIFVLSRCLKLQQKTTTKQPCNWIHLENHKWFMNIIYIDLNI